MLTLYIRSTCPFCQRVMQMANNLNIPLNLKDIDEDDMFQIELQQKSGTSQVPYLVDSEKNISMLESNDIIEYLRENCTGVESGVTAIKPRMHVGGSTCQSCEG